MTHDETFAALTPHPSTGDNVVRAITARIARLGGLLTVTYAVEGQMERVRMPVPRPPRFVDGLWRHTCCEIFIGRKGEPAYHEFNFSPSGEWAVYAFARTRERMPLDDGVELDDLDPEIVVRASNEMFELKAVVRLDRFRSRYAAVPLVINVAAVIEGQEGGQSFWALRHPADNPDFHHPAAFALELNEAGH
jgi:hypothetical protein